MLSKKTLRKVEMVKRMDLKVPVPPRFCVNANYDESNNTQITTEIINIAELISEIELSYHMVIRDLQNQVQDIKKATAILLDIKREAKQDLINKGAV